MRHLVLCLLLSVATVVVSAAEQADIAVDPSCKTCGMDRAMFARSRMLTEYDDGKTMATCSLHCAALDLAGSLSHAPVAIRVADYDSHLLIDAQNAVWVVGGNLPGVMSARGKWAFSSRAQAEKFVAEHGGTIEIFANAVNAAYEDMYRDTLMLREKRKIQTKSKP